MINEKIFEKISLNFKIQFNKLAIMKRLMKKLLLERLDNERGCALIGPRQVGKSYLLKEIIQERGGNYVSLDDPVLREEIRKDPLGFLRYHYQPEKYLFIDEPAKVPEIFDAIKILIDEKGRERSKICIANSGNYILLRRVKESLAGRISLLSLFPLSWEEMIPEGAVSGLFHLIREPDEKIILPEYSNQTRINRLREKMLVWGGYPIPALTEDREFNIRWIRDYLTTYVFPIIIEQFQIRNLEAFERFIRLIFINSGQLVNKNNLAKTVGVSQPTIDNFLYQLKAMMLVHSLEVYHRNPKKRLVKQIKIHAIDPLLLHNALNTNFSNERARELQCFGLIYESFICTEIFKIFHNTGANFNAYYWRTQDGAEVDLIIESQGETIPLEIKSSGKLTKRDASGLISFLDDNPHVKKGYIIYPGSNLQQIYPNVFAVPDWWLLGYQA